MRKQKRLLLVLGKACVGGKVPREVTLHQQENQGNLSSIWGKGPEHPEGPTTQVSSDTCRCPGGTQDRLEKHGEPMGWRPELEVGVDTRGQQPTLGSVLVTETRCDE